MEHQIYKIIIGCVASTTCIFLLNHVLKFQQMYTEFLINLFQLLNRMMVYLRVKVHGINDEAPAFS